MQGSIVTLHSPEHRAHATMSLPLIRSLFAHMAWADAQLLQALRAAPGDDPLSIERYAHVLAAEHIWITRIEGRDPRVGVWPVLSLEECAVLSDENARDYQRFIDLETDATLQRAVTYTNSSGATFTGRVLDILLHVAMHGAYHRGQVALTMRRSGGAPVSTDYILWSRGRPA